LLRPLTPLVAQVLLLSDGSTCDSTLIVENETLKKEVNELTYALGKVYGGYTHLLKCLSSRRLSFNKESLGYVPKSGKKSFASHKSQFVRGNGTYCNKCNQVGHLERNCKNKNPTISSIKFDSCYLLSRVLMVFMLSSLVHLLWSQRRKLFRCPKA
jgi:hypothetical protein